MHKERVREMQIRMVEMLEKEKKRKSERERRDGKKIVKSLRNKKKVGNNE